MRSDARKRLAEENDAHRIHPDPAVCALVERERQKAAAEAWDSAHGLMCGDMQVWGECLLHPGYGHANPYREAAS